MQLVYPPPIKTIVTALPVDTTWKSVERGQPAASRPDELGVEAGSLAT